MPEGWQETRLGDLSRIERGRFSIRPRNDPRFYGGPHPFVQTGDVTQAGTYLRSYSQTLNDDGLAISKMFPAGSILMTIAASIGEVAITSFPVACPDSIVGITPRAERADVVWLLHYLEMEKASLDRNAPKLAQKNINLEVLRPLLVRTPPLSEQKKIAEILSTWDSAIEMSEKLLANAKTQKQALMQELLSGKRRSRGFAGPWVEKPLTEIVTRIQRKTDGGNHPILTISSTSGFVRQDQKYSRYMAGKSVENYVLLRKGEFAYNKGNSKSFEFGCVFDLGGFQTGLVPHVYVCFRLKEGLSHRFFKALFAADYLRPQLGRLVNTGVRNNGLLNISPVQFLSTRVPVPSISEQEVLGEILEAASATVLRHQDKLDMLRSEKFALMQQLLTGKRRVRA
ncbi:restriction endonuclease subunit S [Mesorhizobium sp.]|uniref:restriction endonuclease subunit S n=1 Tax=Mesorhizobium sp. TaxID=1871066 RepID=UPI0025BF33AF|nr:restriction endonuclease subunit S [Mesorhizobium sp.]